MIFIRFKHWFLFIILVYNLFGYEEVETTRTKRSKNNYGVGIIRTTQDKEDIQYSRTIDTLSTFMIKLKNKPQIHELTVNDISNSYEIAKAMCYLIKKGSIAIIGKVHPNVWSTVLSITKNYKTVFFTLSDAHIFDEIHENNDYIIKIRPKISGGIVDFIANAQWSNMVYVYDSDEVIQRLKSVLEGCSNRNLALTSDARNVIISPKSFHNRTKNDGIIQRINKQSKRETIKYVVLDIKNPSYLNEIKREIQMLNSDRADYHFLFIENEITEQKLIKGMVNITVLMPKKILAQKENQNDTFLIDSLIVLDKAVMECDVKNTVENIYSDDRKCGPLTNRYFDGKMLAEKIRNIQIPNGFSGNIQFDEFGFRKNFTYDVFETRIKHSYVKIGQWNSETGLNVQEISTVITPDQPPNQKRTYIITTLEVRPFTMLKEGRTGEENDDYEGFCIDIIREIAKELKIEYKIKLVDDRKYGAYNPKRNTWDGMIGELVSNKADIAIGPLTITASRERAVDFSTPFMEFGLSIMFKKMEKNKSNTWGFLEPLSKEIWMCIMFAYLGVSVVLFLVSRFSLQEWKHHNLTSNIASQTHCIFRRSETDDSSSNVTKKPTQEKNPNFPHKAYHNSIERKAVEKNLDCDDLEVRLKSQFQNEFTIFNSFWFALSTFVQQGGDIIPRSLSGRIVGGVWWFFTLIIVSSYTANLAALLTSKRMTTPIESYEDLAKQTKIKYGIVRSGSTREFFEKSKAKEFHKMWQFMEASSDVFVDSIEMGVEKVRNSTGDYAFILESAHNDFYNQMEPCNTMKVGSNLDSGKGYGIATSPGSDLRDKINLNVLKLKEKDLISSFYKTWWQDKGKCDKADPNSNTLGTTNSLGLEYVYGLFYLLAFGLVLGLFMSFSEFLYKCALESKRQDRKFADVFHEMLTLSLSMLKMKGCLHQHPNGVRFLKKSHPEHEMSGNDDDDEDYQNNFRERFGSQVYYLDKIDENIIHHLSEENCNPHSGNICNFNGYPALIEKVEYSL